MGKTGKGKILVSLSMPLAWCAQIDQRAEALHMTRATYLRLVVEYWRKAGSPPVSEPDRYMQVAKKNVK
jgi:hypothetical protein